MTRPKPRIIKGADGWQVALPAFGFAPEPVVRGGFASREAAGDWLANQRRDTHNGGSFDRASAVAGRSRFDSWPVVVR